MFLFKNIFRIHNSKEIQQTKSFKKCCFKFYDNKMAYGVNYLQNKFVA
jgi:hypothetical protein